MQDPHLNVFHAYRGATSSEGASIRQLEDNLTRSLIITLDLIRDSPARILLLKALGIDDSESGKPYQCQLQVSSESPDWPSPLRRRLVVIHGGPQLQIVDFSHEASRGRVDAIVTRSDCLLAIESKLENAVGQSQLDRHRCTLKILNQERLDVTWSELVRRIRSIPREHRFDPLVDFILTQFEEYLQMNGFGGLTHEHFSYFAHGSDRRDPLVKDGIRRSLATIGNTIQGSLGTQWTPHVMSVMSGARDAGVVIETGKRASNPHLTVGIDVSGLSIFANVELQRAHQAFMRAWKRDPLGLIEIIRHLGSRPVRDAGDVPWRFSVVRRVSLGPVRQYHYWTAADIATNALADWPRDDLRSFIDTMVRQPSGEAVAQVMLIRTYAIPYVLASSDITVQLSADALEVAPFFDWIKHPYWCANGANILTQSASTRCR